MLDILSLDDAAIILLMAGMHSPNKSSHTLDEAVGVLYDRYGRLVYSVAIHIVGDSETAEEITQDVFVRACDGAHGYRPEAGKVSSWLVSITRHRAIDELRRRGTRPEKNSVSLTGDDDSGPLEIEADEDGPEELVETMIERKHIRQGIAGLPTDQRRVVELAFFQGMTHSQMAETLGEPLGTVKSRVRLAMQRLRGLLIEQGVVDP
jgi:RNA polymerase sigma-70 factor (ECF subfamily)